MQKKFLRTLLFNKKIKRQTNEIKQRCNETSNGLLKIKVESHERVLRY